MTHIILLAAFIAVMIAIKFWIAPIVASFGVIGLGLWIAVCLATGLWLERTSAR